MIKHAFECEVCGKPATRVMKTLAWYVTYQLKPNGKQGKVVRKLPAKNVDADLYYCDECDKD